MKLWLLKKLDEEVGWDEYAGFVIRAPTSDEARQIANAETFCSQVGEFLDPRKTSCEELKAEGPTEVILSDFRAG